MVKNRVVYSTDKGDQRNKVAAASGRSLSLPPVQQNIKLSRDKKGRKGKVVTVAAGFALTEADLTVLAKTLKVLCGAGGTAKIDGDSQLIEIQGDHRDKIAEKLQTLGYKVKFAGG